MTASPNDPAQSGITMPERAVEITLSLPEVQAQMIKAARGAGLSWGMAEEAGFAAVWLTAAGLNGPRLVTERLEEIDGADWATIAPVPGSLSAGRLCGSGDAPLCPLATGSYLSDYGGLRTDGCAVLALAHPILLLPFLGLVAGATGRAQVLRWAGGAVTVTLNGPVEIDATRRLADEDGPCDVRLSADGPAPDCARKASGVKITAADWAWIDRFAARTYVPATDQSRAGAGAGETDRD